MDKKFITDIKLIRDAIDTKKLVVFVGAGISIDAGIPPWSILINEMKSEIDIPANEQDYLKIAQMYYNERQQKEYIEKVRTILKHKKIIYNELHTEIFQLSPEHILTTNYDELLDQVIKKNTLPYSIIKKDSDFPYALNTNLLVKIHGDLDNTDFVLKEDDYIDYSLNHPLIEGFIKSIFATKVVLFVGYSFSDVNLKMIIQNVRNILDKDFQNAYLLSVEEKFHPTQREYLKKKGINVINYFDANESNKKNYITEYLKGKNAFNVFYYQKGEHLSATGQLLFNFLKFISTYDKFNEPISNKNVIDQIYFSLDRFSEFTSLPPDFVANLYPFNPSKKFIHSIEAGSLSSINDKLMDLFYEQIKYVNEELKFNPPADLKLSKKQIVEYERKLETIIKKLNYSLILYIKKENQKPGIFGHNGWSVEYKELQCKKGEICSCFNCRLFRLEISNVISEILNSNINETTDVQTGLEIAYMHYKLGNFKQSYSFFEEVASKAWQSEKYYSYYIAKHNIKTLRNLVKFYERNLPEEEKEKILQLMKDIDFDKLFFQIPYMGESGYELLKIIRDDGVLLKAEISINEAHSKIIKLYDDFKNGDTRIMGPNYPQTIQLELYKIIMFYSNNYIVIDEFRNFTKVCRKAIEALLVSFATDEEYDGRLKEFDKFFFDIVVSYGNANEIKSITQKYAINQIIFKEESFIEIIKSINNFFKSFFYEDDSFSKSALPNKLITNQINNKFFEDKCRQKFDNIFIMLSKIKLEKEKTDDLITNLISFLKHETFIWGYSTSYLNDFINNNFHIFNKEDLEYFLKEISNKSRIYKNGLIINTISLIFEKNNFSGISDRTLIFKLLNECENYDKNLKVIIPLWRISSNQIKKDLKKQIIDKLDRNFDIGLYTDASYTKIIDYNRYFTHYISEIDKTKGKDCALRQGRPIMKSFTFINAMMFIYSLDLKKDDVRLKSFTNLSNYMEFYLFPEEFNYDKFKVAWLFIAPREIFFNRFKNIPAIKNEIVISLKNNYDLELSDIYIRHFL